MLNIQYASDLHIEFDAKPLRRSDICGNLLVLAGDIAGTPASLLKYLKGLSPDGRIPIVYVMGNHEFYGHDWNRAPFQYQNAFERSGEKNFHFLNEDEVVIQGVRFLGTTLWTDFKDGQHGPASQAGYDYEGGLRDFDVIHYDDRKIIWQDVVERHKENVRWLDSKLAEPFSGPTVVVTHHSPSFLSNPPQFDDSPIAGAFCNSLDSLVEKHAPELWIHGHLHNSSDYRIGKTRVLVNPFGYYNLETNVDWNPGAMVTLS